MGNGNCKQMKDKKIIDLNDKNNINDLSKELDGIQDLDKKLIEPIHKAIDVLKDYEETHDLTTEQIHNIYEKLCINENMSPEEMDKSLQTSKHIAIVEKKYFQANINRSEFSLLIKNIVLHFSNIVSGNVLSAIVQIIENFSCICMFAQNKLSFKDVCFKFFSKDPKGDILVLILNIHYQQKTTKHQILDIIKYNTNKISIDFLGALVKTELDREHYKILKWIKNFFVY